MVPAPTRYHDGTVAVSVCSSLHSLTVQLMKVPPFRYQMHLASLAWISWQRRHDQNERLDVAALNKWPAPLALIIVRSSKLTKLLVGGAVHRAPGTAWGPGAPPAGPRG